MQPLPKDTRSVEELLVRLGPSDCVVAPCFKLEFAEVYRPPAMKIPAGGGFTAYDYSENRSTPFSFKESTLALEPPPIAISNVEAEEPLRGSLPPSAPLKALDKARKKLTYEKYGTL